MPQKTLHSASEHLDLAAVAGDHPNLDDQPTRGFLDNQASDTASRVFSRCCKNFRPSVTTGDHSLTDFDATIRGDALERADESILAQG
jgi:hypothetical protein